MSLYFRNGRSSKVYVAISLYEPARCSSEGLFNKIGWFHINPGEWARVWEPPMTNRYIYFYAEAEDGAVWKGACPITVPNTAFNKCKSHVYLNGRVVLFREVDIGNARVVRLTLT